MTYFVAFGALRQSLRITNEYNAICRPQTNGFIISRSEKSRPWDFTRNERANSKSLIFLWILRAIKLLNKARVESAFLFGDCHLSKLNVRQKSPEYQKNEVRPYECEIRSQLTHAVRVSLFPRGELSAPSCRKLRN